jgi:DNA-binding PadR family transcriptional regulator
MNRQLLLLGVLLDGKMHGYKLNEYVEHTMGFYTDLKKPTVYYVLEKLEKDGYVQQKTERQGKRPERRVYQITHEGRTYFLDLLRQHLSGHEQTYYSDDIGIAFLDQLSKGEVRQLLAQKQEKILALLQQFREVPDHRGNWRYVIGHNITHLEADVAWLNSIIDELNGVKE